MSIRYAVTFIFHNNNEKCDATVGNLNKWFAISLKLPTFEGERTKVRLLRPQWWLDENHISHANDVTFIELPEMGIAGVATVTDLTAYSNSDLLDTNSFPYGEGRDGAFSQGAITGTFEHEVTEIQHLALSSGDTLHVTAAHPFYSLTHGTWRYAGELEPNEALLCKDKSTHVLSNTTQSGTYTVYNIEVRQWHNYLVGKDAVVVHNSCVEDNDNENCALAFAELLNKYDDKIKDLIKNDNLRDKIIKYSKCGFNVPKILPNNDKLTKIFGKDIPKNAKLLYDKFGFPDFSDFSLADCFIDDFTDVSGNKEGMVGDNSKDYKKGVKALMRQKGISIGDNDDITQTKLAELKTAMNVTDLKMSSSGALTIDGVQFTWHHHQDGKTMQLLPLEVHQGVDHGGGKSLVLDNKDNKGLFPSPAFAKKYKCPN